MQLVARATPAVGEPRRSLPSGWRLVLALVPLLLWSAWIAEVHPGILLTAQTWRATADLVSRLFPPDLSLPFLRIAVHAMLTTAATAVVATALSIAVALPLGILASSRMWRTGVSAAGRNGIDARLLAGMSWLVLHGMGMVRSIPDLVWALLFVAGVGLGPLAGTLALAVSYAALLGRVYADIFDEADRRPLEALQALGANRLQIFLFGIAPQSMALLISYTLYSFECCVRSAAVLGFVGAGGLGYEISLSMRLFEYGQVLTLIGCFALLLLLVDLLSRSLRSRLRTGAGLGAASAAANLPMRAFTRKWLLGAGLAALLLACLRPAGLTPLNLLQEDTVGNLWRFTRALFPLVLHRSFLGEVSVLALQTIGISVLGTAIGALFGFLLAMPATRSQTSRHESLGRTRMATLQAELAFWSARMVLNLLRSIPELVWVLLCVVAVGFGPFAGSLALGLHTAGVLGKLFAETLEETPQQPVEAMLAFGASPLQCMFWALLPQSWPMMRRYILLRWDMNLRAATILGLVGGGGLGQALYNDMQLGLYGRVSTLIAAVMVLVIGSDWLSHQTARLEIQT